MDCLYRIRRGNNLAFVTYWYMIVTLSGPPSSCIQTDRQLTKEILDEKILFDRRSVLLPSLMCNTASLRDDSNRIEIDYFAPNLDQRQLNIEARLNNDKWLASTPFAKDAPCIVVATVTSQWQRRHKNIDSLVHPPTPFKTTDSI